MFEELKIRFYLRRLRDRHPEKRRIAAYKLRWLRDVRAVNPLIAALRDEDADVRAEAVAALGMYQRQHEHTIDPLIIGLLQDPSPRVRKAVVDTVRWSGYTGAVEPLIAAMKDEDASVRVGAAEALRALELWCGRERAVESLIGLLQDSSPEVREAAALSLGWLGDKRAVNPLIAALRDENIKVCVGVVAALARLRDERATEPLAHALRKESRLLYYVASALAADQSDRRIAVGLIFLLQDHLTVLLIPLLEDHSYQFVVRKALLVLASSGVRSLACIAEHLRREYDTSAYRWQQDMDYWDALALVASALMDEQATVRCAAAWTLGELHDWRAIRFLNEAMTDDDPDVRRAVVDAIAKIRG